MVAVTINISDNQLQKLQQLAKENGISVEDLLRASIGDWLSYSNNDFAQASNYVLTKNAELYRRLA